MSEQQRLSHGRGSPYCAWCNRSGHNAMPACRDAYEERRASIHPIEKLWREVGLPEYFLGNGGTNDKLYALYDRILCAAQSSQQPIAFAPFGKDGRPQWAETFGADDGCYGDYPDKFQPLYAVPPSPVAGEARTDLVNFNGRMVTWAEIENAVNEHKWNRGAALPSTYLSPPWDAHHNRSYEPVETRAKEIYDFFEYKDAGTKPDWLPGGNSLMQDEARICARKQLRDAGHTPAIPPAHRGTEA